MVKNNYLHNAGELMVKAATDCKVRDNIVVNGDLQTKKSNTVVVEGNQAFPKDAQRPAGVTVVFRPNSTLLSANLAIFTGRRNPK